MWMADVYLRQKSNSWSSGNILDISREEIFLNRKKIEKILVCSHQVCLKIACWLDEMVENVCRTIRAALLQSGSCHEVLNGTKNCDEGGWRLGLGSEN